MSVAFACTQPVFDVHDDDGVCGCGLLRIILNLLQTDLIKWVADFPFRIFPLHISVDHVKKVFQIVQKKNSWCAFQPYFFGLGFFLPQCVCSTVTLLLASWFYAFLTDIVSRETDVKTEFDACCHFPTNMWPEGKKIPAENTR